MRNIIVVGGGYAGVLAAARLARKARGLAQVTLVSAKPELVERIRNHQVAAGGAPRTRSLARTLRHTGVDLRIGWVSEVDLTARRVRLDSAGTTHLGFDELVLATGSEAWAPNVPGGERAHSIADVDQARALGLAIDRCESADKRVAVVGGGLTAIELATELATRRRDVHVTMIAGSGVDPTLSEDGRQVVRRRLASIGVELIEGAQAVAIERGVVHLDSYRSVAAHVVAWCAGFTASPVAARAGLAVDDLGRARVDGKLRSLSHPFVRVAGDAARVEIPGPEGSRAQVVRMGCVSALPMGAYAADEIAASLESRHIDPFGFAYMIKCVALGRASGVIDRVDPWDRPRHVAAAGLAGALVKELVCRFTVLSIELEARGVEYVWPKPPKSIGPMMTPFMEERA